MKILKKVVEFLQQHPAVEKVNHPHYQIIQIMLYMKNISQMVEDQSLLSILKVA